MSSADTELDRHREANADTAVLADVRARIADAGVEFVYCQVVTLTGRVVGKVVSAGHLARVAEHGVRAHPGFIADLQVDRGGGILSGDAERGEVVMLPDLDSFGVLPWDTRTGFLFCRMYEPAHAPGETGGRPVPLDARGNLRRVHEGFRDRTGLRMRTGCEPEVTWSVPGVATSHRSGMAHPLLQIEQMERLRPVYQKVIAYGRALGLDMSEGNCEGPGQLELNWMFDLAEHTADRLMLHRQVCRQVARELGVTVSFMPKPANGELGNGCHHNVSLWEGERNILVDPAVAGLHLTPRGRHVLGGILAHTAASTAVFAPTVNSYKRLCDDGGFAPARVDWGFDNKTCAVRLPDNGRLEIKTPDAMVNPYLSHAVLIAAIEDGLKNGIDPGPPRDRDTTGPTPFGALPTTLKEALDRFADDPVPSRGLGADLAHLFLRLKTLEWERFCCAVTDWEHAMYGEEGC
ncbi:glutamine synthetase [Embleya scabrispora]|uniref:Glutamine synthetase n=1 Tax=Embleya scabrispora TaxID=159449 RepID=A0A1T3NMF1_9ACTN|nr:glutamine synthetase family protein [Embleya scabrispora]OPC77875.1 glutamine synthetase [Embleya scabrispora]